MKFKYRSNKKNYTISNFNNILTRKTIYTHLNFKSVKICRKSEIID